MSADWRERVLEAARLAGMKPIEMLSQAAKVPPAAEREHFQVVLTGLAQYTPEELTALWDGAEATWLPEVWVRRWVEQLSHAPAVAGGGLT
ncbi:MAG: hypothetical protein VKM92_00310 [Cyanobacteriota bacterium]|nr:hypothetical protein [Cyanobacteriota bacterium]